MEEPRIGVAVRAGAGDAQARWNVAALPQCGRVVDVRLFWHDPLILARMVERDASVKPSRNSTTVNQVGCRSDPFLERVRTHMYANYREPTGPTVITAIGDLIARNTDRSGVSSVMTFNFDDLLEVELRRRKVSVYSVINRDRQRGRGLRIIHPHGYIPRDGASRVRTSYLLSRLSPAY